MFNKIFPLAADNNFNGHKIALWGFILFTLLMTWRSIIHMLFEKYGFHEIGNFLTIEGDPDPMLLIYRFFSLWGFVQLIFCLVCWVVIFRYRNLIPLMYLLWLVEWVTRLIMLQGKELQEYFIEVAPGNAGTPYVVGILILFFLLSLRIREG